MYLELTLAEPRQLSELFKYFTKHVMIQVTEQSDDGVPAVRVWLPLTREQEEELMQRLRPH